jgi:hypothetical protein
VPPTDLRKSFDGLSALVRTNLTAKGETRPGLAAADISRHGRRDIPVRIPGLGIALTLANIEAVLPRPAPSGGKLSVQPIDRRRILAVSIPIEVLEAEVLRLPRVERARLLDRVVASLDADKARDEAWERLAATRDAELESGASSPVSGPEAIARLRAELL